MPSVFHRCLNLLLFENKSMEESYAKSQQEILKKVFFFFSLASICLHVMTLILGFFMSYDKNEMIIRGIMLLLSMIPLLLKNRLITLQALIFLSIFVFWGNYAVSNLADFMGEGNLDFAFVLGEMFGAFEMIFTLTIKNLKLRFLIQVGTMIGKVVGFKERMIIQTRVLTSSLFIAAVSIMFCILYDFLDRKDFRQIYESREKLKKFQYLLSHDFPSSVIIITTDFSSILYSNHLFQKKFGALEDLKSHTTMNILFKEIVLEKTKCDINIEADKDISLTDYLLGVSNKVFQIPEKGVATLSATYKDTEGIDQYYEIKIRKIVWDEKPSYAIILNDVSDKQIVAGLKLVDEQKDRVIATVSHELRTPINGIMGLLEMTTPRIMDRIALTYLEHCKSCSKLLLYLVNSILDLSQLRHNSLRIVSDKFDIRELLEEVRSLYLFQSQQKQIEFMIDLDPQVPEMIFTDKNRLIEILINLLGNAMKFTFDGHVKLIVSPDETNARKILFRVEDTGIGIREENKSKLFKMFGKISHANRNINSQGVGLGLTIANELVRALNSDDDEEQIQFESDENKGSSFWFKIDTFNHLKIKVDTALAKQDSFEILVDSPQLKEYNQGDIFNTPKKISRRNRPPKFLSEKEGSSRRHLIPKFDFVEPNSFLSSPNSSHTQNILKEVLLVDDNPFNLMTASFIVEKLGFNVSKAFNGQECLNLLEDSIKQNKKYSFILTDIQMPLLDGLEMSKIVTKRIQSGEMYEIPIVAITANKLDSKEKQAYRECGILYSLEKPLSADLMKDILNNLNIEPCI